MVIRKTADFSEDLVTLATLAKALSHPGRLENLQIQGSERAYRRRQDEHRQAEADGPVGPFVGGGDHHVEPGEQLGGGAGLAADEPERLAHVRRE